MVRSPLLQARGVTKSYVQGQQSLQILKGLDLDLYEQEAVVILGASGAGKSTFLQILGTLDRPDAGALLFQGKNLFESADEGLAQFRNKHMGFVFQFHHLISELSAVDNVLLPHRILHGFDSASRGRAEHLLVELGLSHRLNHYPSELSGGELQRVSIARALMNEPQIILADEPTGNLDSQNSARVQDLFFSLQEKFKVTLIVVTHDLNFAARFPRILKMKDGLWVES